LTSRLPVGVIGYVEQGPHEGQYAKLFDDYPGGIYAYWSNRPDFTGEGWDNWFEDWQEANSYFEAQVGPIRWGTEADPRLSLRTGLGR
jgi:hypothetical protein